MLRRITSIELTSLWLFDTQETNEFMLNFKSTIAIISDILNVHLVVSRNLGDGCGFHQLQGKSVFLRHCTQHLMAPAPHLSPLLIMYKLKGLYISR